MCCNIFVEHNLSTLKKIVLLLTIISAILLQACSTTGLFEKTEAFADHAWASSNRLNFSFNIEDTDAWYNVYAVLRHTDAYRYNNIYINITSINPGDTAITTQRSFLLANNNGWLGSAMDDIIEHRMVINDRPVKLKKGIYTVMLQQVMREDPLQNILNAGVRVEKVVQ